VETIDHNRRVLGVVVWSYWSKLTLSSYMNLLYPYVIIISKLHSCSSLLILTRYQQRLVLKWGLISL